jgi:hypothetical protein
VRKPLKADIAWMAMKPKPKPLPALTDAERQARFLAMAKEVEASEDPKDFDKAFEKVTRLGSKR